MASTSTKNSRAPLKSCYFADGNRKIDYVLISSKKIVSSDPFKSFMLSKYLANLIQCGLELEREEGTEIVDAVCEKIHAPTKVLEKYAKLFNIELCLNNPHYKYEKKIKYNWLACDVTKPNPQSPVYQRASATLSGVQPRDFTNAERILIVHNLLMQTQFGSADNATGFEIMIQKNVLMAAYPLHDTPYQWTKEGPLSDRQLLAHYWANLRYFYKEQPLNLIEKYFGPEVAFYYAWMGFYTKMLVLASIMGILSFAGGLVLYFSESHYIVDEVCKSHQYICPVCPNSEQCSLIRLKDSCVLMKMAYILDNPATVVYAILMTFWGVIFMSKWNRKQAMFRLRWNLNEIAIERRIRSNFLKKGPTTKKSSITGENEFYVPKMKTCGIKFVTYLTIFLLMICYVLAIMLVILFRLKLLELGRQSSSKRFHENMAVLETFSSSLVTFIVVLLFDSIRQKTAAKLTDWENPPTQLEYDRLFTIKLVIISVTNTFFPLMYLAFFKGHLYTHPGDVFQWTFFGAFEADVCKPSGCLVDISVQLLSIMLLRNAKRYFMEIGLPMFKVFVGKCRVSFNFHGGTQWEDDYVLIQAPRNFLFVEYITMVVQYGMVTFFVAALPLAPVLALFNNILEIRTDAIKMIQKYRRLIPRRVNGIGGWNDVLQAMTVFGAVSNPLVIALTSNLVPRYIYRLRNRSLRGYVNSTLSEFNLNDYALQPRHDQREKICYYFGKRFSPNHPNKYELTVDFWYELTLKCFFFIVLENFCLLVSMFLKYVLPTIPRKVQLKLEHEQRLLREARLNKKY